jgi:hypothetical protein
VREDEVHPGLCQGSDRFQHRILNHAAAKRTKTSDTLTLDVTRLSPDESAAAIIAHARKLVS